MKNKKILLTLTLTCLITPLINISATNNNMNNYNNNYSITNNYNNQNNYINNNNQNYYNMNNYNNNYFITNNYNNHNNYINNNNQNYYNMNNMNYNYNQGYYVNYSYYNNLQKIINNAEIKVEKAEKLLSKILDWFKSGTPRIKSGEKDWKIYETTLDLSGELYELKKYNYNAIYNEIEKIKNLKFVLELCLCNIYYQNMQFDKNDMKKRKFLELHGKNQIDKEDQKIKYYILNYSGLKNLFTEKIINYKTNYNNIENRKFIPYYEQINYMFDILIKNFQNIDEGIEKFPKEYLKPFCFEDLCDLDEENINECLKNKIPNMLVNYKENSKSFYEDSEEYLYGCLRVVRGEQLNFTNKDDIYGKEFHENKFAIKYLKKAHSELNKILTKFNWKNPQKIQKIKICDLFAQQEIIKLMCKQTKYYEKMLKNEQINKKYLECQINKNLEYIKYLMNESEKTYVGISAVIEKIAKENDNTKKLCHPINANQLLNIKELYCSLQTVKKNAYLINLTNCCSHSKSIVLSQLLK